MILTHKMVRDGYTVPRWYGVAYFRPDTRVLVCYLIPFHWPVRWARQIWWAFLIPRKRLAEEQKWNSQLEEEFTWGYNQGRLTERRHLKELTEAMGLEALPKGFLEPDASTRKLT